MNFETTLKSDDIRIKGIDADNATAIVYWHLEMETRSWGVRDIYPVVDKVAINFETETGDMSVSLPDGFIYEFNPRGTVIYPSDIDYNHETKACEISF